MKVQDKIIINATVDKVFKVFTELGKAKDRISAITDIEILEGPAKMEVGTKWKETRKMFGKEASEVMRVTKLENNRNCEVEAQSHGMKYVTSYKFVELPHQETEVQLTFDCIPLSTKSKLMMFMTALSAGATKKAFHKDMEDLKRVIEGSQADDGK